MWIFLGIVAAIALIITVILLLPVYVVVKSDEQGQLMLRYKFLHMTFGENPDPNNPIIRVAKEITGLSKTDKEVFRSNVKKSGVVITVQDTLRVLLSLLREVVKVVKYCTLTKLELNIVCTGDDAADAAIGYGKCCAAVYPFIGFIGSVMKIKKRGQNIGLRCDYNGGDGEFSYHAVIRIRVCRVLAALIRIVYKEAMNTNEELQRSQPQRQKSQDQP